MLRLGKLYHRNMNFECFVLNEVRLIFVYSQCRQHERIMVRSSREWKKNIYVHPIRTDKALHFFTKLFVMVIIHASLIQIFTSTFIYFNPHKFKLISIEIAKSTWHYNFSHQRSLPHKTINLVSYDFVFQPVVELFYCTMKIYDSNTSSYWLNDVIDMINHINKHPSPQSNISTKYRNRLNICLRSC